MNYGKEFQKYAMSDHNISSSKLNYYEKQIESSMTPYILEERELRATQMDIFSRLMMDRLLWVAGPVNDGMSTVVPIPASIWLLLSALGVLAGKQKNYSRPFLKRST